jgi:hypothetical protein
MATISMSAAVASLFTEPERLALAGFLAGHTGLTHEAYALDLRQFASWCQQHRQDDPRRGSKQLSCDVSVAGGGDTFHLLWIRLPCRRHPCPEPAHDRADHCVHGNRPS